MAADPSAPGGASDEARHAEAWLVAPVSALSGVGPRVARTLAEQFEVTTIGDLLTHYPAQEPGKYRDVGAQMALADAPLGEPVTLVGAVTSWNVIRPRGKRLTIAKMTLRDDHGGTVEVPFFNQDWRPRQTPEGTRVAVAGILEQYRGKAQLKNPKLTVLDEDAPAADIDRIQATYPAVEALPTHRIAGLIRQALDALPPLPDYLPAKLRERHGLVELDRAVRDIHRPPDLDAAAAARTRLVYDELLCLQVGLAQRRHELETAERGLRQPAVDDGLAARFLAGLPFAPTAAQERAFGELGADLRALTPMHRLLQGDVGTGKTLVAAWAMLAAVDHGRQAVLMAPTEVLAEQHYRTLARLLAPVGVDAPGGPRLGLLTGSMSATATRSVLAGLAAQDVDLLIGTHAVLEDRVMMPDLGVVVVDEQHRFGVEHRARLRDKRDDDHAPDVLVMTATPIPRSLALTLYGDLDVTVLDERPGALRVKTVVLPSNSTRRDGLCDYIRERVTAGERAFWVCPLIEPSEALAGTAAATATYEHLAREVFDDLDVGLVHGRLSADERDARMEAFRRGELHVLVATTVIEVGVDVPDATIMVVEDANRFGLSQLHQLRGRLYRGRDDNYCVLFSADPDDNPRLQAMAESDDGFALAETDLALRGEGSLFDTRQSGLPDLRLAKLARDLEWVRATRTDARELVASDPDLAAHPALAAEVVRRYGAERLAALRTG